MEKMRKYSFVFCKPNFVVLTKMNFAKRKLREIKWEKAKYASISRTFWNFPQNFGIFLFIIFHITNEIFRKKGKTFSITRPTGSMLMSLLQATFYRLFKQKRTIWQILKIFMFSGGFLTSWKDRQELSLCQKLWFFNNYIFTTPLYIFFSYESW